MDKAYKILAAQQNISNREAKSLLDSGLVSFGGKKIRASDLINQKSSLKVMKTDAIEVFLSID